MSRFQTSNEDIRRHFYGPILRAEDQRAMVELVERKQLSIRDSSGVIAEFEALFSQIYPDRFCQLCTSGTNAIFAAMAGLELKAGDKIVFPRFGFHACVMPARLLGLDVVLADVTTEDLLLDPQALKACVGPQTKAVFVLHLFGKAVDMSPVLALQEQHGFALIEDCSHAFMARNRDRLVGSLGDVAVCSFQQNKMIACGEGGVLWARDKRVIDRVRQLAYPGAPLVPGAGGFQGISFGLKFRPHPLVAWLATNQIHKRDVLLRTHAAARRELSAFLARECGFELMQQPRQGDVVAGYCYVKFRTPSTWDDARLEAFRAAVGEKGRLVKAEHFQDLSELPGAAPFSFGHHRKAAQDRPPESPLKPHIRRQFGIRLPMDEDADRTRAFYKKDLELLKGLVLTGRAG